MTKEDFCNTGQVVIFGFYYMTQAVRGLITKINQSKCSIAGPVFSKYWTKHCPEWSRTCVFAVSAFYSRAINLLLTKLARDRTGRISALGLFCMDLAALCPYCQDLGLIFSQYGPRAWLIRHIYWCCSDFPFRTRETGVVEKLLVSGHNSFIKSHHDFLLNVLW